MTDITELAQRMKAAAEKATPGSLRAFQYDDGHCGIGGGLNAEIMVCEHISKERPHDAMFIAMANPANILSLVEALEKAQRRNAELEAQNDYFASLVAMARVSADKAIRKFPQPNYVLLKVAEEAGEVVQAGVHYAENRMEWGQVEGEIVQLLAMLIRLVTEGDQVNGITPPASCSAGIKVEAE